MWEIYQNYPFKKSLLEPMSKGKLVFPHFPTRRNYGLPLVVISHMVELYINPSRWTNFPVHTRFLRNVAKPAPCVAQFRVTYVCSLFLEVKLDNFPTREGIIQELPCGIYFSLARSRFQLLVVLQGNHQVLCEPPSLTEAVTGTWKHGCITS